MAGDKSLTGYKDSYTVTNSTNSTLPDILNLFISRLNHWNREAGIHSVLPEKDDHIQLHHHQVRFTQYRVNTRKAAGPDGVTGRILKACADQLARIFTTIFNLSLLKSEFPTCFKSTTIILLPKKSTVNCLNDYRPVALTPIITKCFERLIISHIKAAIAADLDHHQSACRANIPLTHLDQEQTYVRMLFVDFSSYSYSP